MVSSKEFILFLTHCFLFHFSNEISCVSLDESAGVSELNHIGITESMVFEGKKKKFFLLPFSLPPPPLVKDADAHSWYAA